MLQVPVYNRSGQQVDIIEIDEQALGGTVKTGAMHQAVVMYEANRRVGTASTLTRGQVNRTGAKAYRQKGTGRSRRGSLKAPGLRGGGIVFGPHPRDYSYRVPRKALKVALRSALLGKIIDKEALVVDELAFTEPKTREMAQVLRNLKIGRSCLIGVEAYSPAAYKSARNIALVELKVASDINAYDVLLRKHLLLTRAAFDQMMQRLAPAQERS